MKGGAAGRWPWEIPHTWAWTTAGESAEVVGGGTPRTGDPGNFNGGDIPWITPADLSGYSQKLISRGSRNITRAGLDNSGARLMPTGSVLFSSRAPIGYVAIAANEVCTNQGFKSFVPANGLVPDYLYYYLQRAKELAIALASGTTFSEISGAKAAQIPLPLAPCMEQQRIVAELEKQFTRLDAAVEALKRVQASLKRYRAAVLKAACEGRLAPFNSLEEVTVNRILREPLVNGRSPSAATEGTPILRLTAMRTATIDLGEVRFGDLSADQQRAFAVKREDIFISRGNGSIRLVGRASLVRGEPKGVLTFPDTMIRIRLNEQMCHPEYFLYIWNSDFVRSQIERTARTTAGIYKISQKDIEGITVPLPALDEQRAVVSELEARLSNADFVAETVVAGLRRADRLRQSVLKRAFEGRLVPQDPNDEPASVLLQRIRTARSSKAERFDEGPRAKKLKTAGAKAT